MAEKVQAPGEDAAKGYEPMVDESPTLNADPGPHSKHDWHGFKVQGGQSVQMCVECGKTKAAAE